MFKLSRATRITVTLLLSGVFGMGTLAGCAATPFSAASHAWTVVASPNVPGMDILLGVTCSSPTFCVAVGEGGGRPLAESWNGRAWRIQSVSAPHSVNASYLLDVDCVTGSSCLAVGEAADGGNLVESWDGRHWRATSRPPGASSMRGLSCPRIGFCVAVGSAALANLSVWNGSHWKVFHGALVTSQLEDVSCSSQRFCQAVGSTAGNRPYAESWNGKRWASTGPAVPTNDAGFLAVSCWSASSCLAVGYMHAVARIGFAERWNGLTWTSVDVPIPKDFHEILTGVACSGLKQCVVVGFGYSRGASTSVPIAYVWNGSSLRRLTTARADGAFNAVALVGGKATGVGNRSSSPGGSLIEQGDL